jgi:lipopolysaccharide biosynthesis protein
MKNLCIFIHYKNSASLPVYVQIYVNELTKHFDEVVIVHNEPLFAANETSFNKNISFVAFPKEGYDFGLFYKYFSQIEHSQYHQIACVNDSNVLFNELLPVFSWSKEQDLDFWGLIDSNEKPWFSTHKNNYHIQSHFLVFNKRAIFALIDFFSITNIDLIYSEKDPRKLRRLVIDKWEIGLSCYLLECGMTGKSFIDSNSFLKQNNVRKPANLGHKFYIKLAEAGLPVIKKKVILNHSRINPFKLKTNWETILLKYGNKQWDIEALIAEMKQLRGDY